jgi:hypothetical protein
MLFAVIDSETGWPAVVANGHNLYLAYRRILSTFADKGVVNLTQANVTLVTLTLASI